MSASPSMPAEQLAQEQVRHLLTTHILLAAGYHWPGSDGFTLEDMLHHYQAAAQFGHVPKREELCTRHPELAAALTALFDSTALND